MGWMDAIVEERIRESMAKGEFDHLPGLGKPLPPDEEASVPAELRLSFKLLKNAGMLPEELELRKELCTLQELLACCEEEAERIQLRRTLSLKRMRYEMLMESRGWQGTGAYADYGHKIQKKVTD